MAWPIFTPTYLPLNKGERKRGSARLLNLNKIPIFAKIPGYEPGNS
jgi:hypothetical protein